jgi:hypothetical protein
MTRGGHHATPDALSRADATDATDATGATDARQAK